MRKYLVGLSLFFCLKGAAGAMDKICVNGGNCPPGMDQAVTQSTPIFIAIEFPDGSKITSANGLGGGAPGTASTATLTAFAASTGPSGIVGLTATSGTATSPGIAFSFRGEPGTAGSTLTVSLTPNAASIQNIQSATAPLATSVRADAIGASTGAYAVTVRLSTNAIATQIASSGAAMANADASGVINTSSNPIDWTRLKNVPAGFADGTDDGGAGSTGTDGDNLGSHISTRPVTMTAGGLTVSSIVANGPIIIQGVGDPVIYIDSPSFKMVVQGTTMTVAKSSFNILLNDGASAMLVQQTSFTVSGGIYSSSNVLAIGNVQVIFSTALQDGALYVRGNRIFGGGIDNNSGTGGGGGGGGLISGFYSSHTALVNPSSVSIQGNTMKEVTANGFSTFTFTVPVNIPLPVQSAKLSTTSAGGNGAQIEGGSVTWRLVYSSDTTRTALYQVTLDDYWNGKRVYLGFKFSASSTTEGSFSFDAQVMAHKAGVDDHVQSFATAISSVHATAVRTGGQLHKVEIDLGTMDNAVGGDTLSVKLDRLGAAGRAPVNAEVIGLRLYQKKDD